MKVEKITVYRIVANISCGCTAQREFKDELCKEPIGEATSFTPCTKHKGKGEAGMAEMILTERVAEEAEKAVETAKAAKVAQVRHAAGVPEAAPAEIIPGEDNENETAVQPGGAVTRIPLRNPAPGAGRATIHPAGTPTALVDARKAQAIRNTQIVTGEHRPAPVAPAPAPAARPAVAPVRPVAPVPGQPARTGPVKFARPTASTPAPARVVSGGPQSSDVHETAERLEHAQSHNLLDAFLEGGGGEKSEG